jgi:K+-sensing histidine kinase KdpD
MLVKNFALKNLALKNLAPIAAALAVVSAVTALLFTFAPDHPVFFYLLPIVLVTALSRSLFAAVVAVLAATLCADYFLYDPLFSFAIESRVEFGDLACVALVALIGVKCTNELFYPAAKLSAPTSR